LSFTEEQIQSLAPKPTAFTAGKKLSPANKWSIASKSARVLWGEIKGSGKTPYKVQVDLQSVAYKCTCPSRQFPCKHAIGVMLLLANDPSAIKEESSEPEWVQEWMDKREAKASKVNEETTKEYTPKELEKQEKAREKTQQKRVDEVNAGVAELELWIKDIARTGFLELSSKPQAEFTKVIKRMVDAKAPALANWVRELKELDYSDKDKWHDRSLHITARLYLLLQAYKNIDSLSPLWQSTIRNLIGWSQSPKELLNDSNAETIHDTWIVAGQEEETVDNIAVQKNWLLGCTSNRSALILHFATQFSHFETAILPGSIITAELAFFPSVTPLRAVIKKQESLENHLQTMPNMCNSFDEILSLNTNLLSKNPFTQDLLITLNNARIVLAKKRWLLCDEHKNAMPLSQTVALDKMLKWKVISGDKACATICIMRKEEVIPFGIFMNNKYELL